MLNICENAHHIFIVFSSKYRSFLIFYCFIRRYSTLCALVLLQILRVDAKTVDKPYFCNASHATVAISSSSPLQGFLTSPGYPNYYPPDQHCTFALSAPPNSGLVLHFAFIDLDLDERFSKSAQCLRDYIRFMITDREGREYAGPRICGRESLPPPMRGMQSKVDILFKSSYAAVKHRGFKIRFEFVPEAKIGAPPSTYNDANTRWQRDCGGTIDTSAPSGKILSPGFPDTFPRDVACHWLIRVEPHERVYLRLIHLELSTTVAECERASLLISDGYRHELTDSSSRRLSGTIGGVIPDAKYCGGHLYYNEEGAKSYLSASNRVLVKFVSQDQPTHEQYANYKNEGTPIGFRLLWTKVVNSAIVDTMDVSSEVSDDGNLTLSSLSSEYVVGVSALDGLCEGFLCKGGEFCLDTEHGICTQRSRLCINASLRCNGESNCAENDDSDEYHCYLRDTVTLMCVASFVGVLFCTLTALTLRSLFRCKTQRQKIKNTRKLYGEKVQASAIVLTSSTPTKTTTPTKTPTTLASTTTILKATTAAKTTPTTTTSSARETTTIPTVEIWKEQSDKNLSAWEDGVKTKKNSIRSRNKGKSQQQDNTAIRNQRESRKLATQQPSAQQQQQQQHRPQQPRAQFSDEKALRCADNKKNLTTNEWEINNANSPTSLRELLWFTENEDEVGQQLPPCSCETADAAAAAEKMLYENLTLKDFHIFESFGYEGGEYSPTAKQEKASDTNEFAEKQQQQQRQQEQKDEGQQQVWHELDNEETKRNFNEQSANFSKTSAETNAEAPIWLLSTDALLLQQSNESAALTQSNQMHATSLSQIVGQ